MPAPLGRKRIDYGVARPHRQTSIQELFWKKVKKTPTCWFWTGTKLSPKPGHDYGRFSMTVGIKKQKPVLAHRLAWELTNGVIPQGLDCLHKCDTPACVRPDHLFVGTHLDNMRDAAGKGRFCWAADLKKRIQALEREVANLKIERGDLNATGG